MLNKNELLNIYNRISERKITLDELLPILPKLYLILNNYYLDDIEIISLIDTLLEFKKYNQLEKINVETVNIMLKITKNSLFDLEGTLYLSMILKHMLLPYNLNKSNVEYNMTLFISEFELFLELANKILDIGDLELLFKYNPEFTKLLFEYKKSMEIYNKNNLKEIVLSTIISHISTIFYFNQENYDFKYEIISDITTNSISSYQDFINFCDDEGIYENFSYLFVDLDNIQNEYIASKKMLDFAFAKIKGEKKKRKC